MILKIFSFIALAALSLGLTLPERRGRALPFPEETLSTMAAAAVISNCRDDSVSAPGYRFANMTVLKTFGDGDKKQRVKILLHDSLGIIVSCQATDPTKNGSLAADNMWDFVNPPPAMKLKEGKIMEGWRYVFNYTWDQFMLPALYEVVDKYPGKPIYVTGHSQGAGTASVFGLAVRQEFPDLHEGTIVSGAPKIGDTVFTAQFNHLMGDKYVWTINGDDPVALAPPKVGYLHPRNMIWIEPADSDTYYYFPEGENLYWFTHRKPTLDSSDHLGVYFGTTVDFTNCGPTREHDVF